MADDKVTSSLTHGEIEVSVCLTDDPERGCGVSDSGRAAGSLSGQRNEGSGNAGGKAQVTAVTGVPLTMCPAVLFESYFLSVAGATSWSAGSLLTPAALPGSLPPR